MKLIPWVRCASGNVYVFDPSFLMSILTSGWFENVLREGCVRMANQVEEDKYVNSVKAKNLKFKKKKKN